MIFRVFSVIFPASTTGYLNAQPTPRPKASPSPHIRDAAKPSPQRAAKSWEVQRKFVDPTVGILGDADIADLISDLYLNIR